MKVVFPDKIALNESHKQEIEKITNFTSYDDIPDEEAIIKRIKNAKVITANWVDITKKIIDSTPTLKAIIVPAVGYEWVDANYARSKGIDVINCPTHNTYAVAEHTLALMLSVSRKIVSSNIDLLNGEWRPNDMVGVELKGKKVLLIGHGNIGSKTKTILQSLGMNVIVANSKTTDEELNNEIKQADYIVLNIPLTPKTKHLMNLEKLSLMKSSSYLINTSRGAVVDQQALTKLLQENRIAGAALDVFEDEPLTGKPSDKMLEIVKQKNVVATPHIGFNTKETSYRLGLELIDNLKAIKNGKPINVVNK